MPTESRPAGGAAAVCVIGSYAKALVMTVDRIPGSGETLLGYDYRQTYGGKGSDMAVQAARLGARVEYVGVVGDDPFGREFAELMRSENIGIAGLRVSDTRPTGVGFIVKDRAGANVIVVDMGANELFGPEDITRAAPLLGASDVALAQLEIPPAMALAGLRAAKAAGLLTILNPAPAVDLRDVDLSCVDVITPNQTEARVLVGLDADSDVPDGEIAATLMARGAGAVVVTRGELGALVFGTSADGTLVETSVSAVPVDVVDSNGAGDSFNAALAVALGEGQSLAAAARFAVVVAGLCCEHWETVPSYQDRATVQRYLEGSGVMEGASR